MSTQDNHELEVKFRISSAEDILTEIHGTEAVCEQPVQFERNLRWDNSRRTLTASHQVLRLRNNGGTAVLTFKAQIQNDEKLADREEIETVVSDFDNMQLILERLGYEIVFVYEKYRSVYSLNGTGLFVDHTPVGDFLEIEGPDGETIRKTAELLGLKWEDRIDKSYLALFKDWKEQTGYPGRDMIFTDEK